MFILGVLYLDRSIRALRNDLRADIKDLCARMDTSSGISVTTGANRSETSATEWGGSKVLSTCCAIFSSTEDAAPPRELDPGPDGQV